MSLEYREALGGRELPKVYGRPTRQTLWNFGNVRTVEELLKIPDSEKLLRACHGRKSIYRQVVGGLTREGIEHAFTAEPPKQKSGKHGDSSEAAPSLSSK